MMKFDEYLRQRLEAGGFTTEDVLASVLPLVRQVAAAHRAGLVAPLQGVNDIDVENNRFWFEEGLAHKPVDATRKLHEVEKAASRGVEVVGQYRMDIQVESGTDQFVNLNIGRRGEPITHPVYLPGYVSWEHELGHHDPLTDVFVLGLILASCSVGIYLNDPDDVTAFVQRRRNLFELNPQLHPVLAKVITRMTELDRSRDRGLAEPLVLGGELFEDGIEGEGLVVGHGDADGAERGAVGGEERHNGDPGLGIGDQGGRVKGNSNRWILKNPIECVRIVLLGSEQKRSLNLVASGR